MKDAAKALKRKFGPLPVWAWAAIAGAAVYVYRQRKSAAANVPAAQTPGVSDQTAGLVPGQVLEPGEGYYDPNSGKLTVNPAAGDSGAGGAPPAGSGDVAGPEGGPTAAPGMAQHTAEHRKGAASPKRHAIKSRARSKATIRAVGRRLKSGAAKAKKAGTSKPPHGTRPRHKAAPSAKPERGRASPPPAIAQRSRPAAPRIVDHGAQQVIKHPAKPPAAAHRRAEPKPAGRTPSVHKPAAKAKPRTPAPHKRARRRV